MHIKEITFGGIFAIIFVSTGLPSAFCEYGMDIQSANYKILHQHPQLKKCTETYLFKNGYVGCRVSVKTGKCQGLLPSWESQGIEEGYAYALKVSVQTTFQPPLKVEENEPSWEIPVTLKAGVQIDTFLSIPTWPDDVRQWILGVMLCQANPDIDSTFRQRSRVEMK
ncbi:uncharacterized protein LOC123542729 [Mercenaria mercenaria]|uniref:uncharacterized protein LOC123542729 n=1 Tax=Mercenaria mercenaria TaxID=6596 RepID=UPI00234F9C1E|nr:uncharacterized protein LOC123542729 [Mercenaria mercenaria]